MRDDVERKPTKGQLLRRLKAETQARAEALKQVDALAGQLIEVHDERARLAKVLAFWCAIQDAPFIVSGPELAKLPDGVMLGESYDEDTDTWSYACVRPKPAIIPATPEHIM